MRLAIKTKSQSPTNRASGRLQGYVGGRSAPSGPLPPQIIPLIINATRQAPNQEQVPVTSVREKNSSSQGLLFFWLSFFLLFASLKGCISVKASKQACCHVTQEFQAVTKIAWGEKPLQFMYSSGHLCIIYLSSTFQCVSAWLPGSEQQLYRDIIRREQVWQMDYNHNWERGESIVLAAVHLLCLWHKQQKR